MSEHDRDHDGGGDSARAGEHEPAPAPAREELPASRAGRPPGRDPFTVEQAAVAGGGDYRLARSYGPRTLRTLIFAGVMVVVATTVAAVLVRRNHHPVQGTATYQAAGAAGAPGVILREDQTRQFEQLMTAMGQERKLAEGENRRILAGLATIQGAQAAQDRRIARLEEISSDLVSRGLAKEGARSKAAGLPEALQALVAPALAYCQRLLLERGLHGWAAVREPFAEWARVQAPASGADDLRRLYDIAQVAREAIADAHYDAIPQLARKRSALRIARDDLPGLVHLVWLERTTLPPSSAGQLVAMANLVARAESPGTADGGAHDDAGALAGVQDLIIPREMRIGFQPCRTTDVVRIIGLAVPYLCGGVALDEQDARHAAYGAARAAAVADAFLRRRSERPAALYASLLEEGQHAALLVHHELSIASVGDERQRRFAAACCDGLVLARAVREGVQEATQLDAWGAALCAALPAETVAGLDLTAPQRAYAVLLARDLATPLCPPQLGDAMDQCFAAAVADAGSALAPEDRGPFLVAAAIQAGTAAVVAARTLDQASPEQLASAIRGAVALSAVQLVAESQVRHAIDDELIPLYAGLYEGSTRDWVGARAQFQDAANAAIAATLASRLGELPSPALGERVRLSGRGEAETVIARTAALDAITRDLDRFAAHSPLTLMRIAREHSMARVTQAISAQTPHEVQIRSADAIAHEAIAIAQGKRRVRAQPGASAGVTVVPLSAPVAASTPAAAPPAAAPAPGRSAGPLPGEAGQDAAEEAIQIVHAAAPARLTTRSVTIPAGAYAEARIFSGVVCELGNEKPEPMLINLDYSWSGPAGTVLTMKDLRLIADCTAMGGAPRVRAHIITISYDLPDGSHCAVPVDGWAVDDVAGEAGAIGVWNWNLSAVAPLGMLDGVLGGLAGLLQPTQQTTSVNTNITIQQTETTPTKNTGEGAAVGLNNSVGKHLERTLENIKPAVEVPNNQACTVVLRSDAVLPIPLAVWNQRVDEVEVAERSGFVR